MSAPPDRRFDPTPWVLALLVGAVMIPMNGLMHLFGIWRIRPGFGHHPWGFGVLVPSVIIVVVCYDRWSSR